MAAVKANCHFPENLSQYTNEACFVGDLGMYKMVDITKEAESEVSTSINYKFENPRNDPRKILVATEPTIPLLPPNEAYRPGYTMTLTDVFKKGAHLQTLDQFENLCESYPSFVFGPIADFSLFNEWECYRKNSKEVFEEYDDVLYLGCSRDLIMNELQKEMDFKGIEAHANHFYHGGCLSFMPAMTNTDKVAGILLYPSGAAMDILTVTTLTAFVKRPNVRLSAKSENNTHCVKLGGVIRQIESMTYPGCYKGYCIVRTDYQCHLVKINLCNEGDVTMVTIVESINSQHRPTSVAVSPFIPTEHICALDSGEVILSESCGRFLRSDILSADDRKINPIFSHFGAHPREAFIHDHNEALLYDFRSPNYTKNSLYQLPSSCLPVGQSFCVARQHPTDHFYHYIATQDALMLLDQRFPQHTIFHTSHHGRGMPSYLEVSSCHEADNTDIVMVANHAEKQVHCVFVENEIESVPRLFSLPWKVSCFDEWLEVVDGVKTSGNSQLWERLAEPLLGLSACPVSVQGNINSWNVLQVSGAGDIFCQSFSSPRDDQSPEHQSVGESSKKLCELWMKSCPALKDVQVLPQQRCRERSAIEYHPSCEQCEQKNCILGAKSNHGMRSTILKLKKQITDDNLVQNRKEALHKLWYPLMCENCAMNNAHSISVTGGNNSKWKGFVKCLKLPWQDDVESSNSFKKRKEEHSNLTNGKRNDYKPPIKFISPAKVKTETTVASPVGNTSLVEIQTDFGSSSLVIVEENAEIPLSQVSFLESPSRRDEDTEGSEVSFSRLLESKKKKIATRRKKSSTTQGIGF